MKSPVHIVTRLRLDAALYQPASPRQPKQMGRPRKVGKRLPALKELSENPYTPWQTVVVKERQWSWRLYPTNRLTHSRVVSYRAKSTAYPLGSDQRP